MLFQFGVTHTTTRYTRHVERVTFHLCHASSSLFSPCVEREQFDEIEVEKSFAGWKNWPQDDDGDVLNLVLELHVTNYSSRRYTHSHRPASGGVQQKGPLLLHFSGDSFSLRYYRFSTGFARLFTHVAGFDGLTWWRNHKRSLTLALFPPCTRDLFIFFFSLRAKQQKICADFHFTSNGALFAHSLFCKLKPPPSYKFSTSPHTLSHRAFLLLSTGHSLNRAGRYATTTTTTAATTTRRNMLC